MTRRSSATTRCATFQQYVSCLLYSHLISCKTPRGIGNETAEKQAPSALEMLAMFKAAIACVRTGQKRQLPLRDALNQAVADYNRVVIRKFKVDSGRKKMLLNLLRSPDDFLDCLTRHYDKHRHTQSGHLELVI